MPIKIKNYLKMLEGRVVPILPVPIARIIGGVRGFLIKNTYFSQNGEDVLIARYFTSIGISHGHYLDIGCFHPSWISNTKLLHKAGWTGVGIDIDKYKVGLYKLIRGSRVTAMCRAVSPEGGPTALPAYHFYKFWSEIDTLSESVAHSINRPFSMSTVPTVTVDEVFSKSIKPFNFINIDIEGLDLFILNEIDFFRFRPQLICFECGRDGIFPPTEVANYLEERGYQHLFSSGPSHAFALKKI